MSKITAVVKQILQVESGTSRAGNPWQKGGLIVETIDQYPKTIALTLFNKALENVVVQQGQVYDFDISLESREFNGRWYTEASCFRATPTYQNPVNYQNTTPPQTQYQQYQTPPQQQHVPPQRQDYAMANPSPNPASKPYQNDLPF